MQSHLNVETERLNLLPVSDKYKNDILREFTAQITRYLPFTPKGNEKEVQDFLDKSRQGLIDGSDIVFVSTEKSSKAFLGCCGIHHISAESMTLGLWLKADIHGQGFGTEIIRGLINFIEVNFKPKYLIYPVEKDNIASRRIAEKLGFTMFKKYTQIKDEHTVLHMIEYRKY